MHHFAVNWWNPDGQQSPQISTQNNNTTVESPKQLFDVPKPLGLQLSDDSSSTQSFGLARQDINGDIESRGKDVESQMKPLVMMSNPDLGSNPPKVDYTHSMGHLPYHYASPCFGCILPAYGPQALVQLPMNSRMVGISSARLPLPADVAQDEPIYVNPKQYHGILRRRQLRSKLESRNKFIKNRKPYLHESRHLHALNRVRGSGGRFLSTKKVLTESAPATSTQSAANSIQLQLDNNSMLSKGNSHSGPAEYVTSHAAGLDINNISNSGAMFQQPDGRFSSIPSHSGGVLQCIGDCMYSNTNHKSSIFQ